MFLADLQRQFVGTINLAMPLVVLYLFFPMYLFNGWAILLCSLVMGAWLAFLTHKKTKVQADVLQFIPSGLHKDAFEEQIIACGMDPAEIRVRYSYAGDSVAMSMLNTVAIDPMIWHGIDDDEQAQKAQDVIRQFILPATTEHQRTMQQKIKDILTPEAQRFIFKHELGHFAQGYSVMHIALIGIIGALFIGVGLVVASITIGRFGAPAALWFGILAAIATDLFFSYAKNYFFKVGQEYKADMFAVEYSTKEEIEAAADFFDAYELHAQVYRKNIGLPCRKFSAILTGHPDGVTRAEYLRDAAQNKTT